MRTVIGTDLSDTGIAMTRWVTNILLPDDLIDLVFCIQLPAQLPFRRLHDDGHEAITAEAVRSARVSLGRLVGELGPERLDAHVIVDSPASGILQIAGEVDAELVAVGPHGPHGRLPGFFGSTASRLVRKAIIPVLVAREPGDGPIRHILVAVDESEPALDALAMTARLALAHQCAVTGLFAYDMLVAGPAAPNLITGALDLSQEMARAGEEWILSVMARAGIPSDRSTAITRQSHPGTAICDAAANSDLIVMGSHGDPLGGETLGSVARYVVGHAPCPVLVVPGPGTG